MYEKLEEINKRPAVFGRYTAQALWADPYRARKMLAFHLNPGIDVSSRNAEFIETSAEWISERFKLGPGKSVCDFGCGPGLYTSRFARSGAAVMGLDFSENSIRYARAQAQRAGQHIDYVQVNYLEASLTTRFDLITMIMCDFCALSADQRRKLLGVFHDALTDDGAVLLDVYSMAAFAAREEASFYEKNQLDHFWCAQDYYCFVNTLKYATEAVVLDKYSIFPQGGKPETVYNWLQYFSAESLGKEMAEAGFVVTEIYKDISGGAFSANAPEFAIVARKTR